MNAKKIKALRKFCRENGIYVNEVAYDVVKHKKKPNGGHIDLLQVTSYQYLLSPECGRAMYQKWKKVKAKHLKRR